MDDYFAEADEHLTAVRRLLLETEAGLGDPPPAVIDELFRRVHSLKGISAMVELHAAEQIAHHMESVLRAVRQGDVPIGAAMIDALVAGANALDAVVQARQKGEASPAVAGAAAELQAAEASLGHRDAGAAPGIERPSTDVPVWKVTFVPSAELIARGVKVDAIRSRLLALGNVLSAVPRVHAEGGISFEFRVQTASAEGLAALGPDGVSYGPITGDTAWPDVPAASTATQPQSSWEIAAGTATNFVRVDVARLDELMHLMGELVVTRSRLENTVRRVERHLPAQHLRTLQEHDAQMGRQLRDLRQGIMRLRMVPVGEIFRRMPFVVRDLARDSGKHVRLDVAGHDTEIDKFLIERMMDPVLHLVRNAISHGIEPPAERAAAGKPNEGTIRLAATTAGESVILEIADDGAGIDRGAVVARARSQGMQVPDGPVDDQLLLDVICSSGFSTRELADRASGRGVGMAVVRGAVHELGGTLSMATEPGGGTAFTLVLPVTFAITNAIIVHVGGHRFAVPQSGVREVIEVSRAEIRATEGNDLIAYRGGVLPVAWLSRLLGLENAAGARLHAIVVGSGREAVGLLVDRIAGQREVVVKTITDPLIRVDGVSGATELGDGRPVLILDVGALRRSIADRRTRSRVVA